jgi:hypothetical protein
MRRLGSFCLIQLWRRTEREFIVTGALCAQEAARVEAQLQRTGWKAAAVHGDASQQQRTRAVEQFKVIRLRHTVHPRSMPVTLSARWMSPGPA